jgi:hypothetical protein
MYNLIISILTLLLTASIHARTNGDVKFIKITKDSTFTFLLPDSTQSSLFIFMSGDICEVKSKLTDQQGTTWYQVPLKDLRKMYVWVSASSTELLAMSGDKPTMEKVRSALLLEKKTETTALTGEQKRRLTLIKMNPTWPHRVKSAVRKGQVVLEMTADQLTAAWGQPHKVREGFLEGRGKVKFFIYNQKNDDNIVTLADNKVIGWNN